MRNWKKAVAGALCLMMLETPAVLTKPAEVFAAEAAVENTVETPALKEGLVKENGKFYFYVKGVKQKSCWKDIERVSGGKTVTSRYYFSRSGEALAAAKGQGTLVKKIGSKYYGFDIYGRMIKNSFRTVKVKKKGKTSVYRYYFGSNGAAYAGKMISGTNEIAVKKVGKKYYGFSADGKMARGNWVKGNKLYAFHPKTGVYDAAKTKKLRKAAGYEKDASSLRALLGRPKKSKAVEGCYRPASVGSEVILYYDNFMVDIFRYSATGKEIVIGVMGR